MYIRNNPTLSASLSAATSAINENKMYRFGFSFEKKLILHRIYIEIPTKNWSHE